MKIKAVIYIIKTNPDRNGNSRFALRYIETLTGKIIEGVISGNDSNIRSAIHKLGLNHDEYLISDIVVSKRDFKYHVCPNYIGCEPKVIAEFIKKELEV